MNLLDRINDLHDWTETERGKRICTRIAWTLLIIVIAWIMIKTAIDLATHYQPTMSIL
jgi:hypothetical protein